MVLPVDTLTETLHGIEGIVVDQWGVLHDGSTPYPFAREALETLKARKFRLAVLSNSGRRAKANATQLAERGFPPGLFDSVVTSGEVLWHDLADGRMQVSRLCPIARDATDAEAWADGLDISFAPVENAEAVLLMGLPDTAAEDAYDDLLSTALRRNLPVLCSNPDRGAPRADGAIVLSPGALAHGYVERGGHVRFIGKPDSAVFRVVETALDLPPEALLMVGDSLEHDIAGAAAAGWRSVFVRGGLHAADFGPGDVAEAVVALCQATGTPSPDYTLNTLR